MKKHWLISVAMLALVSGTATAADTALQDLSPAAGGKHHMTLDEARKKAHERADKLDKMTQEDYDAQQGKRQAWRAKWKAMTPEEKAAYKQSRHSKRHPAGDAGAPASSMSAPTPPSAPMSSAPMSSAPMSPPSAPTMVAPPASPMPPAAPMGSAPPAPLPPMATTPSAPSSPVPPMEMAAPPMAAPATPSAPPLGR